MTKWLYDLQQCPAQSCRKGWIQLTGPLLATFYQCLCSFQERLDPIDWATYEPYVWANEAAIRPRTAVLYGLLTRLGQQGMEPVSRGAPPGEANVMAVAKQVPAAITSTLSRYRTLHALSSS